MGYYAPMMCEIFMELYNYLPNRATVGIIPDLAFKTRCQSASLKRIVLTPRCLEYTPYTILNIFAWFRWKK